MKQKAFLRESILFMCIKPECTSVQIFGVVIVGTAEAKNEDNESSGWNPQCSQYQTNIF